MNYFDEIQSYFLEKTGRGGILGAQDIKFLADCQKQGIPASSICIAIRRAIESRRELPKTIKSCAPWLDMGKSQLSSASSTTESLQDIAVKENVSNTFETKIKIALNQLHEQATKETEERFIPLYREAYRALLQHKKNQTPANIAIQEVEIELYGAVWSCLKEEEREAIDHTIDQIMPKQLPKRAKIDFRESYRQLELYRRYNLPKMS